MLKASWLSRLPACVPACREALCEAPVKRLGCILGEVSYTWTCPPQHEWHCPLGESRRHEAG